MPDTVVPIVRRPVRRTSTDVTTKIDLNPGLRKLSIGGDSNTRRSPEQEQEPPRIKKTWSPPKKAVSPKVEKKPAASTLLLSSRDEALPPPAAEPHYTVPSSTTGFPSASKQNLPKLPVARDRVKKTQVSYFQLGFRNVLFITVFCPFFQSSFLLYQGQMKLVTAIG